MKIMNWMDSKLDFISSPLHQMGLKFIRILLGWIMIYIYTINYAQRHFLFSMDGVFANPTSFNLFYVSNPVVFEVLYHAAILAALCFVMGVGGRFTTFINFLFFWSWSSAALMIGDGGDNLLRVMFPYLLLTDLYGKLEVKPATLWKRVQGMLHNFGLAAMVLQLCYLYFTAGLMKVQGDMWQDGTALYYILQVQEFSNPAIAGLIVNNPLISVIGSYVTVFFQVAFPFLILNRRLKYVAILTSIFMHIGIWLFMNLPSFSWIMITFELALLSDSEYKSLFAKQKALLDKAAHRVKTLFPGGEKAFVKALKLKDKNTMAE